MKGNLLTSSRARFAASGSSPRTTSIPHSLSANTEYHRSKQQCGMRLGHRERVCAGGCRRPADRRHRLSPDDIIGCVDETIMVSVRARNVGPVAEIVAPSRVIGLVDDAIGIEVAVDERVLQN